MRGFVDNWNRNLLSNDRPGERSTSSCLVPAMCRQHDTVARNSFCRIAVRHLEKKRFRKADLYLEISSIRNVEITLTKSIGWSAVRCGEVERLQYSGLPTTILSN